MSGTAAKGKSIVIEDVEEGEEEDVPSQLGSPSPIKLDEDSDEDEPQLEFPSQSTFGVGGSSRAPANIP